MIANPIQQIIDSAARAGFTLVRGIEIRNQEPQAMSFDQWLSDRNIDCQHLTPELEQSLPAQYELAYQRNAPITEVLIVPADCTWPASGYWVPVVVSQ